MAAAAYADGHIDQQEQNKIWQHALEVGVQGESLNRLDALLKQPPGLEDIVRDAVTLEEKLETYTASVLVIDTECAAGTQYITALK